MKWFSVKDRLPEVGVLCLVYTPNGPDDYPDDINIRFDFISEDYEDWHNHSEHYEHYMAIGGPNAAGPDVVCTGPSEKAPYTHWMPLPEPPAISQGEQG